MNGVGAARRWAGLAACSAAIAWTGQGLASLIVPDPTSILDLTMIAPIVLAAAAVWCFVRAGFGGDGRLALAAKVLAGVTVATAVPCQVAFGYDVPVLDPFTIVGTAAFVLALVVAGIAAIRARVAPRWMGGALIAAQPLAMVIGVALSPLSPLASHGDYTGALGHGLVWWLIGLALIGQQLPVLGNRLQSPAESSTW